MESQPQYPEFRNNPEKFHPCTKHVAISDQRRVKNASARSIKHLLSVNITLLNDSNTCSIKNGCAL